MGNRSFRDLDDEVERTSSSHTSCDPDFSEPESYYDNASDWVDDHDSVSSKASRTSLSELDPRWDFPTTQRQVHHRLGDIWEMSTEGQIVGVRRPEANERDWAECHSTSQLSGDFGIRECISQHAIAMKPGGAPTVESGRHRDGQLVGASSL